MKELMKRFVDATLIPLVGYILQRVTVSPHSVVGETTRRAVADSAEYADSHMPQALCFTEIEALWRHAFGARVASGSVVEFGVWRGRSISFFASLSKEMIYGFDSFEGLREDWKGSENPKGTFSSGRRTTAGSRQCHIDQRLVRRDVAAIPARASRTLLVRPHRLRYLRGHLDHSQHGSGAISKRYGSYF